MGGEAIIYCYASGASNSLHFVKVNENEKSKYSQDIFTPMDS